MKDQQDFRETITQSAEGEGKFIRQSGGQGQHGHVTVRIAPNGRGRGLEIINEAPDTAIPRKFSETALEGVREGLKNGVLAGYPVVDVVVRVVDGSFDERFSSELAFKMAGMFAIKDALKKARPIVLE